jgi:hypothetical protein
MKASFCSETPVLTYKAVTFMFTAVKTNSRFRAKSIAENIAKGSENDPPKDDAHVFFQKCSQIIRQRGRGKKL